MGLFQHLQGIKNGQRKRASEKNDKGKSQRDKAGCEPCLGVWKFFIR